jgi:hypothetical protein
MNIINVGLIAHPLNWITLAVWLFFLGAIVHSAHTRLMEDYDNS